MTMENQQFEDISPITKWKHRDVPYCCPWKFEPLCRDEALWLVNLPPPNLPPAKNRGLQLKFFYQKGIYKYISYNYLSYTYNCLCHVIYGQLFVVVTINSK